jgi:hypothetical protein
MRDPTTGDELLRHIGILNASFYYSSGTGTNERLADLYGDFDKSAAQIGAELR